MRVDGGDVEETEVLVLGAGPGGYSAALRAALAGRRVTLVEAGHVGGVCLNTGCIPTKVLWEAAHALATVERLGAFGVEGSVRVAPERLRSQLADVVAGLRQSLEGLLAARGVRLLLGRGALSGPDEAVVTTADERRRIRFRRAIVATGSTARLLPDLPVDGERVLLARDVFRLPLVPTELLVVGGGFIGVELGSALAALGARVTILEQEQRLLPMLEEETARALWRALEARGVRCRVGARVVGGMATADGVLLSVDVEGRLEEVRGSHALVAVGRSANVAGLGLEAAGVAVDGGQLTVDASLRTNVPSILAVGDVTGEPFLAHRALGQGLVAGAVAAGEQAAYRPETIPTVLYSDPEAAFVGEDEATAGRRTSVRVVRMPLGQLGRAQAGGVRRGLVKLIVEEGTERLLGAGIVGPHAAELIAEVALALRLGATLADVAETLHPHPTFAEAWPEVALLGLGRPLHARHG